MGRALRTNTGGYIYHCLNRSNARLQIFHTDKDYKLFEKVLEQAKEKYDMRILAYCIMPNHFHLVLYPKHDGDLSKFMNWLTLTHTQRWHASRKTTGQGHLYQGRYKSFLCQSDNHFITLVRYVERNAKKANLVKKAENWQWSSVWRRQKGTLKQKKLLSSWPVSIPKSYLTLLNQPISEDEQSAVKRSVERGSPYGSDVWTEKTVRKFNLETTLTSRGRPRKGS